MAHQKRTGIPSIQVVARELCRLITKFRPIIIAFTENDPAVLLALDAANAACEALHEQLQEYVAQGQ